MFFVFNQTHGAVGRLSTLTGKLENRTFVDIGPSHNNRPAPQAYASDDLEDFQHQMVRLGRASMAQLAQHLEARNATGWFYLMPCDEVVSCDAIA